METFITEIVNRTLEEGGTTFNIRTQRFLAPVNEWYYPRYPKITKIVPVSKLQTMLKLFLENNKALLKEKGTYLGTWLNPKTQEVYLDVTISRSDLDGALNEARKISNEQGRKIVTIYNPHFKKTVYVWDDVTA